jgi:hypothetical protein
MDARFARRWVFAAGLMLASAVEAYPVLGGTFEGLPATETVPFETNVRELYPRLTDVCLSTYEPLPHAPGVVLRLNSEFSGFARYRYTLRHGNGPATRPQDNTSGAIPLRFDPTDPHPQRLEVDVQAVARSGATSRIYSVVLGYYPSAEYASAGQRSPGWMVVKQSDLSLCEGSVQGWIIERPTLRDRAEARRRWGHLISRMDSDVDKARVIAGALIRDLRRHEGIPSDDMRGAPGLVQLARAESGADHVWCGNYADIFSAACNALDIPVRKIDMQNVWPTTGMVPLEIGEAHRTNEVFDRKLNRWIWMDLTLGCLGAQLTEQEPLTARDIWRVLDDPHRRDRMQLIELDDATGRVRTVRLATFRRAADLLRFFGPDQRFQFVRLARGPHS